MRCERMGMVIGFRRNYFIKSTVASAWRIPMKRMQRHKTFRGGDTLTINSLTHLVMEMAARNVTNTVNADATETAAAWNNKKSESLLPD